MHLIEAGANKQTKKKRKEKENQWDWHFWISPSEQRKVLSRKTENLRKYFSKANGSPFMMLWGYTVACLVGYNMGIWGLSVKYTQFIGVSPEQFGVVEKQSGRIWLLQSQIPRLFPSQPNHDLPITIFFQSFYKTLTTHSTKLWPSP